MKRSVVVALLCLGVSAPGAFAAEVYVSGNLNESIAASDNYFLSKTPSGYTAKPSTGIELDFLALTPTERYALNNNFSYYKYLGPGANDTPLTWSTPMSSRFNADFYRPLTKYNLSASWSRSDLATTVLQETGTAAGRGTLDTYSAGGSITRELTKLDTLTWTGNITTVSYSDPTQTPYIDYATNLAWNRNLSPTTTLVSSVAFDGLVVDNPANSQRLFWNPFVGVQSHLTKKIFFNANVGAAFVNAYQNGSAAQPIVPAGVPIFQQQTGSASSWVGNANLAYNFLKDSRVSVTAVKSITPTVLGQLQKVKSFGINLSHDINHSDSLIVFAQIASLSSAGTATTTTSDTFSASASLQHRWAREWRTNLSYTYNQRSDPGSGVVRSNTVVVGLVHDFSLYGKPTELAAKTQSELALEDLQRAQQALPAFIP